MTLEQTNRKAEKEVEEVKDEARFSLIHVTYRMSLLVWAFEEFLKFQQAVDQDRRHFMYLWVLGSLEQGAEIYFCLCPYRSSEVVMENRRYFIGLARTAISSLSFICSALVPKFTLAFCVSCLFVGGTRYPI